jgi:hypothetical protein
MGAVTEGGIFTVFAAAKIICLGLKGAEFKAFEAAILIGIFLVGVIAERLGFRKAASAPAILLAGLKLYLI